MNARARIGDEHGKADGLVLVLDPFDEARDRALRWLWIGARCPPRVRMCGPPPHGPGGFGCVGELFEVRRERVTEHTVGVERRGAEREHRVRAGDRAVGLDVVRRCRTLGYSTATSVCRALVVAKCLIVCAPIPKCVFCIRHLGS